MEKDISKMSLTEFLAWDLECGGQSEIEVLEALAESGFSPALVHDDNGHWALTFDAFQDVPLSEGPIDMSMNLFVEKKAWKDTIIEAIIYALNQL